MSMPVNPEEAPKSEEEMLNKAPRIRLWLEKNRFITMAYTMGRRLPAQSAPNFLTALEETPEIRVRFGAVIYRPNVEKGEAPLPPTLRQFKNSKGARKIRLSNGKTPNQNLRETLRIEAYHRFERFPREEKISLGRFVERFRKHLQAKGNCPRTFKLAAPDFNAYVRHELRKLLVHGCYESRHEQRIK